MSFWDTTGKDDANLGFANFFFIRARWGLAMGPFLCCRILVLVVGLWWQTVGQKERKWCLPDELMGKRSL